MGWERIHDGFPGEKFQEQTSSISSGRDEPEEEAGKSATAHSQEETKGKKASMALGKGGKTRF